MPYSDSAKQKSAQHASYKRHKAKALQSMRERRVATKAWLAEQKERPCMDCKGTFPSCCMDFHHRNPTEKIESIGRLITNKGRQKIEEEIAKCDLICANCHRIREYGA